MFTTPRNPWTPGRRSTPASSSRARLTGLFEDGQWFCDCDCDPRLPAVRLQTKKKGKNNGRWFYTCQRERDSQCGFFMFEDVAQAREKEYLFGGGKSRSGVQTYIGSAAPPLPAALGSAYASKQAGTTPLLHRNLRGVPDGPRFVGGGGSSLPSVSTGDELDFMSCADNESQKRWNEKQAAEKEKEQERPAVVPEARPSAKRKRGMFVDDNDHDLDGELGGELNSEEEREMVALAESASQSQISQRREDQQAGPFITPSARRTHDVFHGMPTPRTGPTVGRNSLLIATEQREAKRQRTGPAPATTPSLVRAGSVSSNGGERQHSDAGGSSAAGADDYPITEEVMALLGGVPMLDDDVANSVRRKLNAHALRMKGVERGREMTRSVLQAKEARIAELQARVAQLEKERVADRERIKSLATLVNDMA